MREFDNKPICVQDPTRSIVINYISSAVDIKMPTAKDIIIFWLLFALRWAITLALCGATLLLAIYVALIAQDMFTSCILGWACSQAFLLEHLLIQSIFDR